MQRHKDSEIPEDGAIYYAVNEDGSFVQAVEDGQQYQYINESPMEGDQEWVEQNPSEENEQELVIDHFSTLHFILLFKRFLFKS